MPRLEMPSLAIAGSERAQRARRFLFLSVAAGLFLVILAAIVGPFTWGRNHIDVAGLIGLVAFLAAITVRTVRLRRRPDRVWSESRLLSEQVKSAAWRYAVGGIPYPLIIPSGEKTEVALANDLHTLLEKARRAGVHLPLPELDPNLVTTSMRELRLQTLDCRRSVYLQDRITKQYQYYYSKAKECDQRANLWDDLLVGIEGVGVLLALAKVLGLLEIDLFGVVGIIIAAGTSWMQLNQYASRAQSYGTTADELLRTITLARLQDKEWTEEEWAGFVDTVETILGNEHLEWRAMRHAEEASGGSLS
jgi:hypothetical protein